MTPRWLLADILAAVLNARGDIRPGYFRVVRFFGPPTAPTHSRIFSSAISDAYFRFSE